MAISDDLNSIRTHLEDDYTALEQLGVSVEDRNIENIKDMANQIYAKFPKTSYEEGSNITLSNTLKGKLDFKDGIVGYGDTYQATRQGYNIFNENSYNYSTIGQDRLSNLTKNANGLTLTTASSTQPTDYGRVLFDTREMFDNTKQYLLSADVTLSQTATVLLGWFSISDNNPIHANIPANIETHLTTAIPIGTNPTYLSVGVFGGGITATFKNIQIVEGSTEKPYEQYGASPSPSYPQDIEVVRGKNRANYSGTYTSSSLSNYGAFNLNLDNTISIETNKTYYFSADIRLKSGTGTTKMNVIRSSNNTGQTTTAITNPNMTSSFQRYVFQCTYSQVQTLSQIAFQILTTDTATLEVKNIMIAEENTSYLPYNTLEVVERGKNLFDSTEYRNVSINSTVGDTITFYNSTATKTFIKCAYLYAGTTYTFSKTPNTPESSAGRIIDIVDDNDKILEYTSWLANSTSLTYTPTNSGWLYLAVDINATNIMLETGSTATTFEPYQTPQTYQLSLGEYELYADSYIERVSEGNYNLVSAYEKKRINVNPSTINTDLTNTTRLLFNNIMNNLCEYTTSNKCNMLLHKSMWLIDEEGFYTDTNSRNIIIRINKSTIGTTLTEISNYLQNNNLYVVCKLVTPIETPITDTTLINQLEEWYNSHSFTGTTIIEIDGQLPLIIKVRALKGE